MRRPLVLSFLTLTLTLAPAQGDWPRFRGPNGTGTTPDPLPPIDAKAPLWKVRVPGRGVSSPVIADGTLYVQSAADDGSRRLLLALDAATGKTLWTADMPGQNTKRHAKNSLASGTPAVAGGRVFCVSWDGEAISLHAFSTAGKPLWQQPLGTFASQHGPGHSPAVYGDLVYVNVDQDGAAVLKAFDAGTGEPKWAVGRKANRASYSTPFLLERPGKPAVLVVGTTTEITGYDPATGKAAWAYPIVWPAGSMPLRVVGNPVWAGGRVVCACGDGGGGRYMVAVDPDADPPAKAWELRKGTPYVPCLLTADGLLFWIGDKGTAACADARTGKVVWEEGVSAKDVTASPVLAGGEVFAVNEAGRWFVWKAGRAFDLVRQGEIGEPVLASPAAAGGRLYVRGDKHLFCFGPK